MQRLSPRVKLQLEALTRSFATKPDEAVVKVASRASSSGFVATVFGASGLVGRYVVNLLGRMGSQVIVPYRGDGMNVRHLKLDGELGQIVPLPVDLFDTDSVIRAISRSNVVINLVGKNATTSNWSLHDTNVKAVHKIAKLSKEIGVQKFVHISALGAHAESDSEFFRTKAEGEDVVRDFFPDAVIMRPAPIYGPEDQFLLRLVRMAWRFRRMPVINKEQKLQPVYVHDVALAIFHSLTLPGHEGKTFHLAGPDVYTLEQIMLLVQKYTFHPDKDARMVRVPYDLAKWMGRMRERYSLPNYSWRYNEDLMVQQKYDIVLPNLELHPLLTLKDLHVKPTPLVPTIVDIMRPYVRTNAPTRRELEVQFVEPTPQQ